MLSTHEETTGRFKVLVNTQGRHALWPEFRGLPAGWREILGPRPRAECLDFVAQHWTATGRPQTQEIVKPAKSTAPAVGFGLLFFGGEEQNAVGAKYAFLLETARFADDNGFTAVWLPERHFTQMGSLYPSPAVLHAALSRETKHVRLRSGSVVLPLNDPIRVAEEWAVVDNLSDGRVELSFASGWNPDDFALSPGNYPRRYDVMYEGIQVVERLWSGQTMPAKSGTGADIQIRTYPTPVQPRLIKWITAVGSPLTCQKAGAIGANLLTHLLDQSLDELAGKIKLYREARQKHGHDPDAGKVAVTLHTFLAATTDQVDQKAYGPYRNYLKSNIGFLEKLAQNRGFKVDLSTLAPKELDDVVRAIFEKKFLRQRSLLGTPDQGADLVGELAAIGVNEIACVLDFGPSLDDTRESLKHLRDLKNRFASDMT